MENQIPKKMRIYKIYKNVLHGNEAWQKLVSLKKIKVIILKFKSPPWD